jgi:hypothetical protein
VEDDQRDLHAAKVGAGDAKGKAAGGAFIAPARGGAARDVGGRSGRITVLMSSKTKKTPARKPAKAKVSRARAGGAATVRVSAAVGKDLVAAAERYAAEHRTTVAQLVEEGLRKVVGFAKAPVLPPGDMEAPDAPGVGPWAQLLAFMEEQQAALTEIRNALGDVAASLPADATSGGGRPAPGPRIPPL